MDIMMPEMDGNDTMRAIRKLPKFKSLPIIAVTAKAMKGDREKCIEAGAGTISPSRSIPSRCCRCCERGCIGKSACIDSMTQSRPDRMTIMPTKVNILIVDDTPDKLLALEAVLEELGQNVVRADSGREALRQLLDQEFAVILLDVNMPDMDGFETAALIRQRKRSEHTPIIFITAFGDETHVSQGYSLGAVDYILTPVVPEVLRAKVAVFVDLFRKTEVIRRQADSAWNSFASRRRAPRPRKRHGGPTFWPRPATCWPARSSIRPRSPARLA